MQKPNFTALALRAKLSEQEMTMLRAAYKTANSRANALFDGTFGMILTLSLDGIILVANRAVSEFLQQPKSKIVGHAFWENPFWRHAQVDVSDIKDWIEQVADGGFIRRELVLPNAKGEIRTIDFSLNLGHDENGRALMIVAEGRDVTDRKNIEEKNRALELELMQAQKMESLGTLAGGIAHEINTPIQYVGDNIEFLAKSMEEFAQLIACYEQLALKDDLPDHIQEKMQNMHYDFLKEEVQSAVSESMEGIDRVRQIVQAVKLFSHPDGGDPDKNDIAEIINTSVTVTRNQWKYCANITVECQPDLPPVCCKAGEISQVLLNLIVNAAHAIEQATPHAKSIDILGQISIKAEQQQNNVVISVHDNGTGIKPENMSKIYDMFFTTKPPGQGTGQGLAICQSIIRKHKGMINCESSPSQGTTFVITLPFTQDNQGSPDKESS